MTSLEHLQRVKNLAVLIVNLAPIVVGDPNGGAACAQAIRMQLELLLGWDMPDPELFPVKVECPQATNLARAAVLVFYHLVGPVSDDEFDEIDRKIHDLIIQAEGLQQVANEGYLVVSDPKTLN